MIDMVRGSHMMRKFSFSPDGQWIASCSLDGVLQIWKIRLMKSSLDVTDVVEEVRTLRFALSGDGKRVLGRFVLQNCLDGDEIMGMAAPLGVECIALDYSGLFAANGNRDGEVHVWKTGDTPDAGKRWKVHPVAVKRLSFSVNVNRIVSAGEDDVIRLWDMNRRTANRLYEEWV